MLLFVRRRRGAGRLPDLPRGSSWSVIAEAGAGASWILVEWERGRRAMPVTASAPGAELESLVAAGRAWPPALALAAHRLRRETPSEDSPEALAGRFAALLRRELASGPRAPYVLAESLTDDLGYRSRGEWCWILQVRSRRVLWVSSDFRLYDAPASHFRLGAAARERLRGSAGESAAAPRASGRARPRSRGASRAR